MQQALLSLPARTQECCHKTCSVYLKLHAPPIFSPAGRCHVRLGNEPSGYLAAPGLACRLHPPQLCDRESAHSDLRTCVLRQNAALESKVWHRPAPIQQQCAATGQPHHARTADPLRGQAAEGMAPYPPLRRAPQSF